MAEDSFPFTALEVLEFVLEATRLSQNELATRAGLSKDTPTRIRLTGQARQDTVRKLLDVVGLSPSDFALQKAGRLPPASSDVRGTRFIRSLDAKLAEEFRHCDLRGSAWQATAERIVDRVDRLGVLDVNVGSVLRPIEWARRASCKDGDPPRQELLKDLKAVRGPVRVSTPVIEVGSVAAVLGLMRRYDSVGFELDYSRANGADQVASIRRGDDDFDFAVLGIAAFAFGCRRMNKLSGYALLTPIHSIRQHVVARDHRIERLDWLQVCPGGFAEFQARLGESLPARFNREDAATTSPLPLAADLDDGYGVIAYEPVGETIRRNHGLKIVENTGFSIHIGLFANRRHLASPTRPTRSPRLAAAFLHAFTAEYLSNRSSPERALELLCGDREFCRIYSGAAGVPFVA